MAYPTVSAPYGLKAVNELGGLPYAGSTRMIPISTGFSSNIFYGDIVKIGSGKIALYNYDPTSNPTTVIDGAIGVFVGCEYTVAATGQKVRAQYWPANSVAQDALAYVIDDPRTVFQGVMGVQGSSLANSGTTIGYANPAFVGSNLYSLSGNTGSTTTGDSAVILTGGAISSGTSGNVRVTTAAPFRVVAVVPDTAVSVTATGSTSGSSTTVTLTAANTAIKPGMQLIAPSGTGSLAGNYITVTNISTTTVTVSSAITLASGTAITFVGYPEVRVVWNAGWHSYTNATGA